ncbi:MAG: energy transducer TonB [Spirochaetes bacterium]|nr:energy transducer TonB [Spirochaetota bacterium]
MFRESEIKYSIKYSLVFLISLFIHVILFLSILLPVYHDYLNSLTFKNMLDISSQGRDIIVNINEDNKTIIDEKTLFSEKDSSAKGYITKKKGDRWLNNSRDFALKKGLKSTGKGLDKSTRRPLKTGIMVTDNAELVITMLKQDMGGLLLGEGGISERTAIPDKYSFTKENAIFYSNDGTFSFNTLKFKPFRYFKDMKDKIANHWFPPLLANAVIYGYDPMTGSYTPGRLRIMAIPNQAVKLYFIMNRDGDVLDVDIVESMGNKPLDSSCIDSIKNSKNFGKVPTEIEGEEILIRFVFLYVIE